MVPSKQNSTSLRSPGLHVTLTFFPIVNGSTKLSKVNVAEVGREEEHTFQYLLGQSDHTVWPGNYVCI